MVYPTCGGRNSDCVAQWLSGWNTLPKRLHPLHVFITCSPQQKVIDIYSESRQVSHKVWQLQCQAGAWNFQGSLLGRCLTAVDSTSCSTCLGWNVGKSPAVYRVYFKSESFWRPLQTMNLEVTLVQKITPNFCHPWKSIGVFHIDAPNPSQSPAASNWETLGQRRPRSHPEHQSAVAVIWTNPKRNTMQGNLLGMG